MDIQEINQSSPEFLYQMLGRLEADCLYYLGNGGRFAGHLWAGNEREGIEIEVCGSWVWVTGDTKPHKEELKALSFRWSSNKSAWYFHRDGYKKRSKKSLTLDEIRGYYGSEKIEKEGSGKIAVA